MAEGKEVFEGVPAGADFEASQKALRELNLDVLDEDQARGQIYAKRKKRLLNDHAEIDLWVSEIGQSTEVRVRKSPESMLDIDGKELVKSILSRIAVELEKIKAEGRISKEISKAVYSFGQTPPTPTVENSPPIRRSQAPREKESDKKASGGGIGSGLLMAAALYWIFFTDSGADFTHSLLQSLSVEADISQYDCDKAASLVRGESLQNLFGAQFRIISISSLSQLSKTNERIVCSGLVDLSNGTTQRMRITVERGASASGIQYRVEPM